MRTKVLLCVLLLVAVMTACTNENENPVIQQRDFALTNFSNTGCKPEVRTRGEENNNHSYFELTATDNGGLYVKHVNVYFNCASNKFDVRASLDGQTITVTELDIIQDGMMATCICPYDLGYEVGSLENGKTYVMTVISTYDFGIDDPKIIPVSEETTFSFVYSPTLSKVMPVSAK